MLYKITALCGITAPVFIIYAIGYYTHPDISVSIALWDSLAAYFLVILILLSGTTVIEKLVVIFIITLLALILIFATGAQLSDNTQLLVWSLLFSAWYMPVILYSLVILFDANEAGKEPELTEPALDAEEIETQKLIEKSLRHRKRKTGKHTKQ